MSAEVPHIPVMLQEVLGGFDSLKDRAKLRYFDGTLGRGGHLTAILKQFPQASALAVDRDPEALAAVRLALPQEIASGRLQLEQANFHEFDLSQHGEFDMMLLDLGVSSPQLDEAHRGFSFYHDGPLDMRMDPTQGKSAADWLAELDADELFRLFRNYGEIYRPLKVIGAILKRREEKPFTSTLDLAHLIERCEGWRKKGFHPATPFFMALRILVNNELTGLEESLPRLLSGLSLGGRIAVLTFHSLEDRIVKNILRNVPELGRPVNKKVIQPSREEEMKNPRARSAKLRVFERGIEDAKDMAMGRKNAYRVERT